MKTRLYQPADYPVIEKWWEGHEQPAVPAGVLPKTGVVLECDGQLWCAAWLYQDLSVGVAWLAWLVTNPDLAARESARSLQVLVGAAEEVARAMGSGLLFTMTDRPALGRWFTRAGFVPNHTGCTQYFKKL